jgi:hypothetical protein
MKFKKLPPQQINWAQPQWQYAASGIRCRADWKGAHVYHTEVGWIVAYSQAHANDMAKQVESEKLESESLQFSDLFERLEN